MVLLAQFSGATAFFLLVLMLVIGLLLMRSHRHLSRRDRSVIVRTERPPSPRSGSRVPPPDDLARWEVEMHETARDLSAQLDSKMGALGHLIREADRAAARLEQALSEAAGARGERAGAASPPLPASAEPARTASVNQAEGLACCGATGRSGGAAAERAKEQSAAPAADRRYEEIYTLADYGFEPAEIAQRVAAPIGEIQLILGLRGKR